MPSFGDLCDRAVMFSEECRSAEDHAIIAWANMTTVGVMPAAKYEWFLTSMTVLLSTFKRNGLAVIIYPNRASDNSTARTSMAVAVLKSWYMESAWCE